jgi:hypothetical protein
MAFQALTDVNFWIRDNIENTWESRVKDVGQDDQQRRQVQMLVIHADISTESAISGSATAILALQQFADVPVQQSEAYGAVSLYTYSGNWDIEKMSFDDAHNGTTKWTITLRRTGEWIDWTPATI